LADPVEEDIVIKPTHRIVILEGNYVHLTTPPWDDATKLLNERWFIEVERDVAKRRVIQRHLHAGIAKDEQEAAKRFDENDWPNGILLLENSDVGTAHKRIQSIEDSCLKGNS
jgi:pantothenate kinase